jgi:CheY-like chemotaxis protein
MLSPDCHVLFADDSADDRCLMAHAWAEAACVHHLAFVEDGDEAIRYLSGAGKFADRGAHPLPGLAILDLKMPKKTGLEALQWIRASEEWRTLPVLLLTASLSPTDAERAYLAGANTYLVKPSTMRELISLAAAIRAYWLEGFVQYPPAGCSEP